MVRFLLLLLNCHCGRKQVIREEEKESGVTFDPQGTCCVPIAMAHELDAILFFPFEMASPLVVPVPALAVRRLKG